MALPAPSGALARAEPRVSRAAAAIASSSPACRCSSTPGESLAIIGPSGAGKSHAGAPAHRRVDAERGHRAARRGRPVAMAARETSARTSATCRRTWSCSPARWRRTSRASATVDSDAVVQAAQRAHVHEHDPLAARGLRHAWSTRPARCSRPASGSASRWRARCTASRGCCCSTSPTPTSTARAKLALAETLQALRGERHRGRGHPPHHADRSTWTRCSCSKAGRAQHYGPAAEVMKALQAKARPPMPGGQVVPCRAAAVRRSAHRDRHAPIADPAAARRTRHEARAPVARRAAVLVLGLRAGARAGSRSRRWLPPSSRRLSSRSISTAARCSMPKAASCARCGCATASACAQGEPLLVLGDVARRCRREPARATACRPSRPASRGSKPSRTLAPRIAFPAELIAAAEADPRLAEQIAKERALFDARRDALLGPGRAAARAAREGRAGGRRR